MNALMKSCIAEFIGIFYLTFAGAGAIIHTAGQDLVAIALAHGLALAMAVYISGHISGGHVNPAVTVAMLITGRIQAAAALAYIVSQLSGAAVAAWILKSIHSPAAVEAVKLGATLGAETRMGVIILIEAILTFFLVTTIFGVAVDSRGPKNVYGFAIGLTICFDILAAGGITGASMNPARSFGPALAGGYWQLHAAYWIGPIAGGAAAALIYHHLLLKKDGEA